MLSFEELNLITPILNALKTEGYTTPTPIQLQAIPHLLAGSDLLGYAQTGTGKTAAFALPILQYLDHHKKPKSPRKIRALVLAPTRELAAQISDSFHSYGRNLKLSYSAIFGGVGHDRQIQSLSRGVDVLVATPGRLLDFVNKGYINLNSLEFFVLDEADQMFDMGFLPSLKKIVQLLPHKRQTLLFSATMPTDISNLAASILTNPVTVEVTPVASTADKIDQRVIFIEQVNKNALLGELLRDPTITRALVFSRTKHGANRIYEKLKSLKIRCEAIHGNKSQTARQKALEWFRAGHVRVLVATDIASRGIDVDGISHVINYDLPNVPENYIHRIGRTARAGNEGVAISFCNKSERPFLRDIERLVKKKIPGEESSIVASESDKLKKSPDGIQLKRTFLQKPSSDRNHNGSASFENREQKVEDALADYRTKKTSQKTTKKPFFSKAFKESGLKSPNDNNGSGKPFKKKRRS
jgi:ATP-dependent RNA helicase RhlE